MKEDPLEDLDEMISAVSSDEDGETDFWSALAEQPVGQAVRSTSAESSTT